MTGKGFCAADSVLFLDQGVDYLNVFTRENSTKYLGCVCPFWVCITPKYKVENLHT